ncbi:formyltetrahydrofolate-dependent phosphoribosylglycinamide formyltransferase [Elusimicrobium simillimum]|uniref:phosphoribosylglycinamide formyltransferase n=1 Tax=Elusimicrobium simillimum TaxID=3143438 RepID=UPI003C6FAD34
MPRAKKIVVFASGGGSNFEALANAVKNGGINGEIVLLVASKPGIGAVEKAKRFNVPVFIEGGSGLAEELKKINPDLICLAGYLKMVPQEILNICPAINIHPALLPAYGGKGMYGGNVHKAVLAAGEVKSGATVHYVNAKYDEGGIIMQREVPVLPNDTPVTLAARVLEQEHILYPAAVKLFCEDKLNGKQN